ncbi:helix-turn-helix domain-containing protein [Parafrankia soli]|nr:helix-turn-helix domain-containing protein [Parafrankia soli]
MDGMERLLLSTPDAAARLNIGRSTLYDLIRAGSLATVRVGRRRLVPVDDLARYVASLQADGAE